MGEDPYKMQLARLAVCGFIRDKIQDDRPQPEYEFYTKKEVLNGTEYEFTVCLKKSGGFRMHVAAANPTYDSSIDGIEAFSLETAIAGVVKENIQAFEEDITKKLDKALPLSKIAITFTPINTVGLKGIMVDSTEHCDNVYQRLKNYLQNKGK